MGCGRRRAAPTGENIVFSNHTLTYVCIYTNIYIHTYVLYKVISHIRIKHFFFGCATSKFYLLLSGCETARTDVRKASAAAGTRTHAPPTLALRLPAYILCVFATLLQCGFILTYFLQQNILLRVKSLYIYL